MYFALVFCDKCHAGEGERHNTKKNRRRSAGFFGYTCFKLKRNPCSNEKAKAQRIVAGAATGTYVTEVNVDDAANFKPRSGGYSKLNRGSEVEEHRVGIKL